MYIHARLARPPLRTHVYTRMLWRHSVSAHEDLPYIGIYSERKTIAWCPCTPPSTVERFGEKICTEACSGKEIAGLLKKMMMMMMKNTSGKIISIK